MIARRGTAVAFLFAGIASLVLVSAKPARTQEVQNNPTVMYEDAHDVSLPVREYPSETLSSAELRIMPEFEEPVRPRVPFRPDPVLQDFGDRPAPLVAATIGLNFDGLGHTGFVPPDTNASVGTTQVVETVNLNYQVFNKTTGASILGPKSIGSIFTGVGRCTSNGNLSDPVVLFDKAAGRWLIAILAYNNTFSQSDECIAVSTTSDATGSYNRYDFNFGANLPDYPKFGVWPDAYYFSANTFPNGGAFVGANVCAFDRAAMVAGTTATGVCFQRTSSDFSLLPSDLDGATPPPVNQPNAFLELDGSSFTKLDLFKFHADFVVPPNSTFTGPIPITIPVWSQLCPTTRACIAEPLPGEKVDSLGDRLMFRLAYRNFGSHESLVATHSVNKGRKVAGVRWYEIQSPLAPVLVQSGTIAEGAKNIWLGSIAMDKVGDIAVGFSESSKTVKPSVQFTGRIPGDPLGTMESIANVVTGTGVQQGGGNRWGDYSSMAIDPSDDCTFWYAQEYYKTTGLGTWSTRLASLKFANCH
jgi:hypothetical protein